MKLEIGKLYECIDTCGMMINNGKYIGKGVIYNLIDGLDGSIQYLPLNRHDIYYVFTFDDKNLYKYAVSKPIYNELEFSNKFQVIRYGNELENIFATKQPVFILDKVQ